MSQTNGTFDPFDPTGMFKSMRDAGMDTWSKSMIQLVNTEAYAQASAVMLDDAGIQARTKQVIEAIQREGTCWAGITVWKGRTAMRISVSSWATTEDDVERSLAAILRAAR